MNLIFTGQYGPVELLNKAKDGLLAHRDEMKAFFDGCVNEIIDLIDQEYRSFVEQKQRRPRVSYKARVK